MEGVGTNVFRTVGFDQVSLCGGGLEELLRFPDDDVVFGSYRPFFEPRIGPATPI